LLDDVFAVAALARSGLAPREEVEALHQEILLAIPAS
jgi:hypothetical protein